jgi:hypothetical protein
VPVMGTVLVLLFCHKNSISGRILTFRPMVFVGLISYSLYLWHQPILAFAKMHTSIHLAAEVQLALLVVIFVLSYLTWRFIENPFRNKHKFTPSRIAVMSCCSIAFMFILGGGYKENIHFQKAMFPEDMQRYEILLAAHNSNKIPEPLNDGCRIFSREINEAFIARFTECTSKYDKAVMILGGSHGLDLYNAVSLNTSAPFVVGIARGNCRIHKFIGGYKPPYPCQYEEFKKFATSYKNNISLVIYTQTPDRLFKKPMHLALKEDLSLQHVVQVVDYLSDLKIQNNLNVLMIGMLPPLMNSPIELDYKKDISKQLDQSLSTNTLKLTQYLDMEFEKKLSKKDIVYISKFEGFQIDFTKDLFYKNQSTYSDSRHISHIGEKVFGSRLVNYLYNKNYTMLEPKPSY